MTGRDRRASATEHRLDGRTQHEAPARALVTGPGGTAGQGEGAQRSELPWEERCQGPGEGPRGQEGGHVLRRSSGWDWCISPSFHTQSPTNSNHITQHVVETLKREHLITLSAFFLRVFISPGSPVSVGAKPSPLEGRSALGRGDRGSGLLGCRLESLTHGPAMTVGQAGASAYVFQVYSSLSKLGGPESRQAPPPRFRESTKTPRSPAAALFQHL